MSVVIERNGKEYLVDEMAEELMRFDEYYAEQFNSLYEAINFMGMELCIDYGEAIDWGILSDAIWDLYERKILIPNPEKDIGTTEADREAEKQRINAINEKDFKESGCATWEEYWKKEFYGELPF